MSRGRPLAAAPRTSSFDVALWLGIPLALLWALHAGANYIPGTGYLRLPILFALAAWFMSMRLSAPNSCRRYSGPSAVSVGFCCLFIAATLSTILNSATEEVVSTYAFIFLSGAAVYVSLSGVVCTPAALDVAIAGLAAGTLCPMIGGLLAFGGEWGSPDVSTTISAWHNISRMNSYTDATFGNRGNTAGFILIVAPMFVAVLLDHRKRLALRAFCAATLLPIGLNLVVLQVRAAFIALAIVVPVVWAFRLGGRRLPIILAMFVLAGVLLFKFQPDVGVTMVERLLPVITVDTEADESVQARADAIREATNITARHWLLGIGPGGALTIHSQGSGHQFHLQQWMETGVLGFFGSIVFSVGIFVCLLKTIKRGRGDEVNDMRFLLIIGPAAFLTYATISNATLTNGSVNTWTVLLTSMLALVPQFGTPAGGPPSRGALRVSRSTAVDVLDLVRDVRARPKPGFAHSGS